jgi:hypothetical protein
LHPSLARGPDWVLCTICWDRHTAPYPDLFRDADGQLWDVCRGPCAVSSGLAAGPAYRLAAKTRFYPPNGLTLAPDEQFH